jgi:hypothetical protein
MIKGRISVRVFKIKLDSSFRFATFRMTSSACHSEVMPEADPPLA